MRKHTATTTQFSSILCIVSHHMIYVFLHVVFTDQEVTRWRVKRFGFQVYNLITCIFI